MSSKKVEGFIMNSKCVTFKCELFLITKPFYTDLLQLKIGKNVQMDVCNTDIEISVCSDLTLNNMRQLSTIYEKGEGEDGSC